MDGQGSPIFLNSLVDPETPNVTSNMSEMRYVSPGL